MAFSHLHLHTQYSLLQGAIKLEDLMQKLVELQMTSVAMTDSHNLFGAIDFYLSAKKVGIKPIIGCEVFYLPEKPQAFFGKNEKKKKPLRAYHHLVLLCKNMEGYQNLCKMITESYQNLTPGMKPFVHRSLLDQYGDGLIVLSGCLRGEIPFQILQNNESGALESLSWFHKRFKEDFFLELQDTAVPEQELVNESLRHWGEKFGIECVATTDCHYLHASDCEAHEILQCIENGRNLDFDRPKSLVPHQFYLKTEEEMREHFSRYPKACDNTQVIVNRCELEFRFKDAQGKSIYHLPQYRPDSVKKGEPFDLEGFFRLEAKNGLDLRLQFLRKKKNWKLEQESTYWDRLHNEVEMIIKTGFLGYFLIVADFINWAKRNKIPVGPGRGSGAGSLVAYSLNITDIDPIQFNLLFERFINPERISMPDFDVDFCQDRRGEVIDYVGRKYGSENVCQIITFGKLQARAVIKDVGRVLGLPFSETDPITKLLPDELDITLEKALATEPRLSDRMEQDPRIAQVVKYARSLEGLYRNAGIHAAGVIITEEPVVNYCPLYVGKDGDLVTQFDKDFSEAIGLVKFDFLGLKTLTVIDNAVRLVGSFSLDQMDLEDSSVFALISSGDTDGVFQVESSGMKDLCMRIQPSSIEDLTAINALYRPGPLGSGMVDDFINRKHKRKAIVYDTPALEPILKDTYGVILYQEQVMQIARELAGYSLGQADLLRRAMGKKKPEEMAKHRAIFTEGAVKKGLKLEKAQSIFDLMAKFAEYGFNKSHSAAYAMLTYQTAYLKTHYSSEFMAALMTTEMDHTDKITKYIHNARQLGIQVLSPDVNLSQRKFSVEKVDQKSAIRFGLEAVKGVGGIAVDSILEARKEGPFKSVLDLCKRVSTRKANKKVLESLCLSGALDSIAEVNRASLFVSLENLLEHAGDEQAEKELGQSSLFESFSEEEIRLLTPVSALYKQEPDWPLSRKLSREKEVVGFYVSGHPMDLWQKITEQWLGWDVEKVKQYIQTASKQDRNRNVQNGETFGGRGEHQRTPKLEVRVGGLISEIKEVTTKKGSKMAFGQLEDLKGKIEVVFFPNVYTASLELVKKAQAEAEVLVITGELEQSDENPKILVKSLELAEEAHKGQTQKVVIQLTLSEVTPDQLRDLKKKLLQNRGKCSVSIYFQDPLFRTSLSLPQTLSMTASPQSVSAINRIFGKDVVALQ